jgi:hypothetical protein
MGPLRYHNALGILSKYPLTDTQFHLFKSNVSLEAMMGTKGALVTTMLLPGHEGEMTPVKVQTTHAYHALFCACNCSFGKVHVCV